MQDKFSQHKAEKLLNFNLFFTLLIVYLSIFAGYLDTSIPAFVILFFFLLFTLPNNQYSILEISAIGFLILYLITILIFSTDLISTLKNIIGYKKPETRKSKRRKNKTYSMNKRGQYWFISYYQ